MKKTRKPRPLWTKLVFALMILVGVGFVVAGITLVFQMDSYVRSRKNAAVSSSIERVADELDAYIKAYYGIADDTGNHRIEHLRATISRELEQMPDAQVWIIDSQGYVVMTYPDFAGEFGDKGNTILPGVIRLPQEAMDLLEIEPRTQKQIEGDFYGLLKKGFHEEPNEKWDVVCTRVEVKTATKTVSYLVAFIVPLRVMTLASIPVGQMFGIAFIVMAIFCFVLSILIARPMTRQITGMRVAAQKISTGNYDVELPETSSDEVGELVKSFNQMVESLQNLETMRSQFVSNISHELRTPMTSILGFIEGILDGTIPEDQHEYYISIVRDEVRRLHKLTTELMELTKMESGSSGITKTRTNISELCRHSLISLGPLFDEKGLEVEADLGDQELYAMCDADMIRRVLINIIHNAIKFTPSGGLVSIRLTPVKNKVVVAVEDSGKGLSQEDIQHIWDRFYKADKARSQNAEGMGLGMSIAWNIIKEHGETIRAYNSEKGGAVFEFTLSRE